MFHLRVRMGARRFNPNSFPVMNSSMLRTFLAAVMAAALFGLFPSCSADATVGQPLDIKFQSIDGKAVDLSAMKGKVVLVDFWATWCGPCVGEIPHVKAAYEKLHSKGFEIVGISLDSDKGRLEAFVKEKGMTWPQFFDGKGWKNEISTKFGIHSIPAMWLVDKKGKLVDKNGRQDLAAKVEKLLAE
jgi:thiol-disulfide isomerase/thioredoxin